MTRLQIDNLSKSYVNVPVLAGVSFSLEPGEILGLAGENGAGKSTLIKCLNGSEKLSGGRVLLDGVPCCFSDSGEAREAGIATVPQEFNLIDTLSVYENFFLGRELKCGGMLLRGGDMRRICRDALARLDCHIDVDTPAGELNVAAKQFLEIAKALYGDCRLLIMDEPTTVLNGPESEILFDIVRKLAGQGVAVIFVSHKLHEIKSLCDRIVVLRDGVVAGSATAAETDVRTIAEMMVGRELARKFPFVPPAEKDAPVIMEARNLSGRKMPRDVSFFLRRGEILGVAGLGGSGRTELAETLFGLRRACGGKLLVHGREVRIKSPAAAQAMRMALLPEDRQNAGIFLDFSVHENIALNAVPKFFIRPELENKAVDFFVRKFNIKINSPLDPMRSLSGGNQQKCSIAKQLATEPEIFIFDEPTRGVDVGARGEMYGFIAELAAQGVGCLLISSDLEELIGMCRRVLVMREGRIAGEVSGEEVSEQEIMYLATGVK